MVLDIALSGFFLFLLALVVVNGKYARVGVGEKPLMYNSVIVQFFLNMCLLAFIALSIWLFFYSWRMLLVLLLVGFLTETFVIVPFVEKTLGRMYLWLLQRTEDE